VGDQATEWDSFRRSLIVSGVQLLDRPDELKWTGGDNSVFLTVKNVYCPLSLKTMEKHYWWLEEETVDMGLCPQNKTLYLAYCGK
jgi:hypothetical protein